MLDSPHQDPYRALIEATERDVSLVVVGGEPLYGDVALMQALKPDDHEAIDTGCGYQKAIDVTTERVQVDKGEQSLDEIREALGVGFGELDANIRSWGVSPLYMCADPQTFESLRRAPNLTYYDQGMAGLIETLDRFYNADTTTAPVP